MQVVIGQILNGIILGSLYGIIALGVTMTFGITGIVNFALGEFMMIGAYATWYFSDQAMLPFPVAVLLGVVLAAVAGLVADQALFRFTRNNLVNGLLVSIGLISVMESGALVLFTTTPKNMDAVIAGSLSLGAITLPRMKLVVFLLLVAVIGLTWLGLSRAWLGRATRAYAQNPEAAMLMGVPTKLLQTGVVVYSCALAGFGGGLYASLFSLEPSLGGLFILKGVEAAILAGVGNLLGRRDVQIFKHAGKFARVEVISGDLSGRLRRSSSGEVRDQQMMAELAEVKRSQRYTPRCIQPVAMLETPKQLAL